MNKKQDLIRKLVFSVNKIDGVYYLFARKFGINENELAFIYALNDKTRKYCQKSLSEEWLIPKTTINSIVKKYLELEYIAFKPSDNSKTKFLTLTFEGEKYADKLLKNIYLAEEKAMTKILDELSPEFIYAMDKYSGYLYEEFEKIKKL